MNKFEKVKSFFEARLWPLSWVINAVDKWITADEYREITGEEFEKKGEEK